MADEQPPMPFYPIPEAVKKSSSSSTFDDDYQTFKRVDPNDQDASTKVRIPIAGPRSSNEDVLRTVHAFHRAVTQMGWTSGPKKFNNFELVLSDSLLYRWIRISSEQNQTNLAFEECLTRFLLFKIPKDDALDAQTEHLQNIHKNRSITVADFAEWLEDLNLYMAELPDASQDDLFSDEELKRIFYKAMPKEFRTEFRKTRKLQDEDYDSLRDCMILFEELFPKPASSGKQGSKNPDSNTSSNSNTNNSHNSSSRSNCGG